MTEVHNFTYTGPIDFKTQPPQIGEPFFVLFLRESSMSIEVRRKSEGIYGGYYYKTLNTYAYKMHKNVNGETYLTAFHKTGTGKIFPISPAEMQKDNFLYTAHDGSTPYCPEMIALIEKHMSHLLGFPFKQRPCPNRSISSNLRFTGENDWETSSMNAPELLHYPFARTETNRKFFLTLIHENQKKETEVQRDSNGSPLNLSWNGPRGFNHALRHSATPEDFIRNMVYKSSIKTTEDLQCLTDNLYLLRLFSKIDLKMGAKEALEQGYATLFHDSSSYMNRGEWYSFKFLLANLPKEHRSDALKLVKEMASFRKKKEATKVVSSLQNLVVINDKYSYGFSCNGSPYQMDKLFRQIPRADRQKFAALFFDEFKKDYRKTKANFDSLKGTSERDWAKGESQKCFVKVVDAHLRVYAKLYHSKAPSDGIDRCMRTAMDLFGIDLRHEEQVSSATVQVEAFNLGVSYFDFRDHSEYKVGGFRQSKKKSSFVRLISDNAELGSLWEYPLRNPVQHVFSDHLNMSYYSRVVIASDLEAFLVKVAAKVDAELLRLGQDTTPENRRIYLEAIPNERKYKCNWRYYTLGVPVREVHQYKAAGIKTKKDIRFWVESYNALPEDIYKELLHDAANGASVSDPFAPTSFSSVPF